MRYCLIFLFLIVSCSHQDKRVHNPHISNFAREIDATKDFNALKSWVGVLNRQPIISGNGKPTFEQLKKVNADCNAKAYKLTPEWPTAKEFSNSDSGDCKGYAICKYYALRQLGFKPKQLNLWSGDYKGRPHMILVAEIDNNEYVLDIGAESNLPLAKGYFYKNFQPVYRFNENGWDVE